MKAPSWPTLIGSVLFLAIVATAGLAYRLGAFDDVLVERRMEPPIFAIAKDHLGPYHKIAAVIEEVETWAKGNGEPCALSFGEFLDNPELVDEDRLRSRGGCLTTEESLKEINEKRRLLPPGYKAVSYEARDALIATFGGSPSIGPWKVYAKVFADMKTLDLELSGPVTEIYQVLTPTMGTTRYIFPVRSLRTK